LIAAEQGLARFRALPAQHLLNPMNGVHGGVACTFLDSAMGSAVMTTLDEKTGYSTVDIVHRGSRIATAEGRLTDGDGRVLAHATTTCVLIERK
jgi:acyl-coenzyme A thioesterase PaaI-like protein